MMHLWAIMGPAKPNLDTVQDEDIRQLYAIYLHHTVHD